jgi:rare lipoprotein A
MNLSDTPQPLAGPATSPSAPAPGRGPLPAPYQVGLATWYGESFAGKKTSSGEPFDPRAMTAAHRHLPFGTWVEVRRPDTGSVVVVRITDRGPWGHEQRIIDVSEAAAEQLGIKLRGPTRVELRIVRGPY